MRLFEQKYFEDGKLSLQGAFSVDQKILFKLNIPRRCGATMVRFHLFGEGISNKTYKKYDFVWENISDNYDIYSCEINMAEIGIGLYYYKYEIVSDDIKYYGVSKKGVIEEISSNEGLIQLLIYKENKTPPYIHVGVLFSL